MVNINFNREFYKPIRSGVKTQTLRRDRLDLKKYDFAVCTFNDCPENIFITVTDVGYKLWKDLSLDDAKREGYDSVAELKNVLLRFYPDVNPWDRLYYYRFTVEGVTETVR